MTDRIYIVVTQTGTVPSRILKRITHADYNHVSVSVDPTLNILYSFGRKYPYNPFFGGFVKESPHFGTFKRFSETEAVVLALPVTAELREQMGERLEDMYRNRSRYRYDTAGLLFAWANVQYIRKNTYYCSSFVLDFLEQFDLASKKSFDRFPKPVEFLDLQGEIIYRGKLRLYQPPEEK